MHSCLKGTIVTKCLDKLFTCWEILNKSRVWKRAYRHINIFDKVLENARQLAYRLALKLWNLVCDYCIG